MVQDQIFICKLYYNIESDEDDTPQNCISSLTTQPPTSTSDCDSSNDQQHEEDDLGQNSNSIVWEKQIPISQQIGLFVTPSGPNISEEIDRPVDVFHVCIQ